MQADLFATDFSKATVITMFLLPSINLKLRPKILDMRPGTRVVSNSFDMGDWRPEQTVEAQDDCTSYCRAHLWIVPAKVEGTWKLPDGDLRLEQTYQTLLGTLPHRQFDHQHRRRQGDRRHHLVRRRRRPLHRPRERQRHRRHQPDLDRLARDALAGPCAVGRASALAAVDGPSPCASDREHDQPADDRQVLRRVNHLVGARSAPAGKFQKS